jgi:hypothetical protein
MIQIRASSGSNEFEIKLPIKPIKSTISQQNASVFSENNCPKILYEKTWVYILKKLISRRSIIHTGIDTGSGSVSEII